MTPQQPQNDDDALQRELAEFLGALDAHEGTSFTDTVAELAMQLPPVAPAPSTKAALLARIDALPRQDAAASSPASPAVAVEHRVPAGPRAGQTPRVVAPSAPAGGSTRPRSRREGRRMFRPMLLIGAVAAAAVLFFGGFAAGGLHFGPGPQPTANADPVSTILAQPDALLSSHAVTGGGTATLVWSDQEGRAAIIMSQTGRAPSGKTYQLWYLRSGAAISAGTFDGSATASATKELAGHIQQGDQVAITIEPSGGSAQPTTNPIVAITTAA